MIPVLSLEFERFTAAKQVLVQSTEYTRLFTPPRLHVPVVVAHQHLPALVKRPLLFDRAVVVVTAAATAHGQHHRRPSAAMHDPAAAAAETPRRSVLCSPRRLALS